MPVYITYFTMARDIDGSAADLQRHLRPRRAGAGELQRAARRQPRARDGRGSRSRSSTTCRLPESPAQAGPARLLAHARAIDQHIAEVRCSRTDCVGGNTHLWLGISAQPQGGPRKAGGRRRAGSAPRGSRRAPSRSSRSSGPGGQSARRARDGRNRPRASRSARSSACELSGIEPAEPHRSAVLAGVPFPGHVGAAAGGVRTGHVRRTT